MKYKIDNSLSIREIDNEFFIFERESSMIHTLNSTGSMIFGLLKSGIDSEKIPQKIFNAYETTMDIAKDDTKKYIYELKNKGIIKSDH